MHVWAKGIYNQFMFHSSPHWLQQAMVEASVAASDVISYDFWGGVCVLEARAPWLFLGSPSWSLGGVRFLLFIWLTGPGFLNWLISSSSLISELSAELSVCSWNEGCSRCSDPVKFCIYVFQKRQWDAELPSELVGEFGKPGLWQVSVDQDNSCFTGLGDLFLWFGAIWFRLEKKMWKSKHPASLWKLRTFSFLILKRILKHVCKGCYYRCLSLIKHLEQTWNPQHNMISEDGI